MYQPQSIGFYENHLNRFLSNKERNNQQHAASYQKQVAPGWGSAPLGLVVGY